MPRTTALPVGSTVKVTMTGVVTSNDPEIIDVGGEPVTVPAGTATYPVVEEDAPPVGWPPQIGDGWMGRDTDASPDRLFFAVSANGPTRMVPAATATPISVPQFAALRGRRLVFRQSAP